MRTKLFLLLAVCVVCLFWGKSSDAQGVFRVIENETRLGLNDQQATILLAVENPSGEFSARIKLEILAPNDDVHAKQEISQKIGKGKQTLTIPADITKAALNDSALLWYRLRYEIAAENAQAPKAVGIVSFSQILPEVFELKMITGDAFEEKLFRARVQAVNPATGKAVADVEIQGEIEIEDREKPIKAQAKTDREGFAFLEFNLPNLEMSDEIDLKIVGKKNGVTREVQDDLRSLSGKFVYILTDKPMYQPNQTANLRLQYIKLDNRPVSDGELTVEIENEETEETVFTEKVKTSRFGIAAVAWKIPEGAKLGNYQIYVKNNDDDEIGLERIKITRYDLPNFYVEAKPDRAYYLPNQKTAKIEVGGKYLFGKLLTNAKVRVVSQSRDDDDEEGFGEITGELNDEGKFSAEIDLSKAFADFKPDSWRRFKDLQFSAYVTDLTTNRTEQKRFDVRITNEPIHVYLIGDTYNQSGRLPLNFYVSTFYADGSPAACEVGIYELINKDADGSEIPAELGKLFTKVKTNSYGVARLNLPAQIGENNKDLNLKLVAADGKNATGSFEKEIEIDDKPAIRVETDKTVYRKGEAVKVSVASSEKSRLVFVDIVKNYRLIDATQAKLEEGRAELVFPYREEFKNGIEIAAYFEEEGDDDLIIGSKAIIFPTPVRLEIEAKTQKEIFRPGESATVKFRSSSNGGKTFSETALGVLVLDKAIEERARTESETGNENSFLNRTFVSRMAGFFGQEKVFGNLTVRDIENLNLAKPLNADLELAIEVALGKDNYRPQLARSRAFRDDLDKLFSPYFRAKMNPILAALNKIYSEKQIFPTDEDSLREILLTQNIDFSSLRDAWGNAFRAEFRVGNDVEKLEIWSLGADKLPKTADDLTVLETGWKYFARIGKAIDKAMLDYTTRTNGFITDYQTLREEMLRQSIDLNALRDPWGNPYRFEFTVDRTNYVLIVNSSGADGKADILGNYKSDDFYLWVNRADYFTVTRANLIKNFNQYVEKSKTFPRSETEMRAILQSSGFNPDETKDVFGRPFYIQQKETSKLGNFYRYQNQNLKVIKQKILTFAVRSAGQDGVRGNYDDFELANFSGATGEEEVDFPSSNISGGRKIIRQKTAVTPNGAIGGMVFDPNGAVIPGATVTVKNASESLTRSVTSNENGEFLIDNLPKDIYRLIVSRTGFQSSYIANLSIAPGVLIEVDVMLDVGAATMMVNVTADSSVTIDTSDTKIETNVSVSKFPQIDSKNQPSFTPRVRDYFVETLVWSPELITDKNGSAELKFKMADSLTTWKLYAIGSTEAGEFGVVEKELQTFQPFFAELEPPRILTEGDEIALPVPIRNYTDKKQKVSVSMANNDWSRLLNGATQNIEVAANSTQNAVFNFQAISPVVDGKQKVTALAKKEGDAIEKPVTVKPNGKEIIETQSRLFEKETSFDVNFPANAFPNTRRAEVKIYPNMLAHVAESVEGLLKRPYGCGEQTTSSTYPNLLILKIEKELKKQVDPKIKTQAKIYLDEGYKRLLNYQTESGGFSYWGKSDTPNVALTAYILRFLTDAEDFTEVDEDVVEKAEDWLLSRQKADGSWESNKGSTDVSTAYVARSLSLTVGTDPTKKKSLQAAIDFLKNRLPQINDSFVLANLALASEAAGDAETARKTLEKLQNLSQPQGESLYWTTPNTPFYGWGKTAEIETTALVVQALLKSEVEKGSEQQTTNNEQISRGLSFLLKNKDRYGVWYSTQTTVNVLDALILLQKLRMSDAENPNEKIEIFVNGKPAREFTVSGDGLSNPFIFDASPLLNQNENRIEIKGLSNMNLTMAQVVSTHYVNWNDVKTDDARYFDLRVSFDKTEAKIGEEITCAVQAQRKTYNRYGMLLAEIGLPPGADVDRASLEKARSDGYFSSYDVLPDKVVIYYWASASPLSFSFKFRPRFGLSAQTSPSMVYDYYNEEARTVVAPTKFIVK